MNVSGKRLEEALIYRAESDEKHAELKSKENYLEEILQSNAKKVRAFTKPLLEEVKSSIGISKF